MILADTSSWIQHLRKADPRLVDALEREEIVCHAMVLGELACGHLSGRRQVLQYLSMLPLVRSCEDAEVMLLIERRRLYGTGMSWVDAHLLAAVLTLNLRLWTRDKTLAKQAAELGVRS